MAIQLRNLKKNTKKQQKPFVGGGGKLVQNQIYDQCTCNEQLDYELEISTTQ